MCGRFGASYRDIKAVWSLYGNFSFQTRYNIAPSQKVPVIIRNEGRNEAKMMKWGLVPSWTPDPSMGQRMINARSETLLEKPSFRQAVDKRRIQSFHFGEALAVASVTPWCRKTLSGKVRTCGTHSEHKTLSLCISEEKSCTQTDRVPHRVDCRLAPAGRR